MSFKQSARASHIRTQCNFCNLLFKSTTALVYYVGFVILYTKSTGLSMEVQACIRSGSYRCGVCKGLSHARVHVFVCKCVLWYNSMFEIYMLYRTCPSWHLHVVCSKQTGHLVFTLAKRWQPVRWKVKGQRSKDG